MARDDLKSFIEGKEIWFLLPGIGLFGWASYNVARVCFGSFGIGGLGDPLSFLGSNLLIGGLGFILVCIGFPAPDKKPSPVPKAPHFKR